MKDNKNGKVTLANVIAVAGLALLLVFTWLGQALGRGEMGGTSILVAVGVTVAAALLLWLMTKAKGMRTDKGMWRAVEYGTLALYVAMAALTAPMALGFFSFVTHKGELQEACRDDLRSIDETLRDFKADGHRLVSQTAEGLGNAILGMAGGNTLDSSAEDYIRRELRLKSAADLDADVVKGWQKSWDNDIDDISLAMFDPIELGVPSMRYGEAWEERLSRDRQAVDNWQWLKIPATIGDVQKFAEEVNHTLNAFSDAAPFRPIVFDGEANKYTLGKAKSLHYDAASSVKAAVDNLSPYSVAGIAGMVLTHLLILFNYIAAARSTRGSAGENGKDAPSDGGVELDF